MLSKLRLVKELRLEIKTINELQLKVFNAREIRLMEVTVAFHSHARSISDCFVCLFRKLMSMNLIK